MTGIVRNIKYFWFTRFTIRRPSLWNLALTFEVKIEYEGYLPLYRKEAVHMPASKRDKRVSLIMPKIEVSILILRSQIEISTEARIVLRQN